MLTKRGYELNNFCSHFRATQSIAALDYYAKPGDEAVMRVEPRRAIGDNPSGATVE